MGSMTGAERTHSRRKPAGGCIHGAVFDDRRQVFQKEVCHNVRLYQSMEVMICRENANRSEAQ